MLPLEVNKVVQIPSGLSAFLDAAFTTSDRTRPCVPVYSVFVSFLGRIACMSRLDAAYCYRCRTQRGLCVCVSVTRICCTKNGLANQDAVWGLTQGTMQGYLRNDISDL